MSEDLLCPPPYRACLLSRHTGHRGRGGSPCAQRCHSSHPILAPKEDSQGLERCYNCHFCPVLVACPHDLICMHRSGQLSEFIRRTSRFPSLITGSQVIFKNCSKDPVLGFGIFLCIQFPLPAWAGSEVLFLCSLPSSVLESRAWLQCWDTLPKRSAEIQEFFSSSTDLWYWIPHCIFGSTEAPRNVVRATLPGLQRKTLWSS